jgi:hypothetical protein
MTLTPDEIGLIEHLIKKLQGHDGKNYLVERYYEGKNKLKDLRISIPPQLTAIETVVGWAGTAVDVLEERLDLEGFLAPENLGVNDIFRANELDLESSLGHKDALIFGTGFVTVGRGMDGEADPLITIESPKKMTSLYDLRTRRLSAALLVDRDANGKAMSGTLYLPDQNIYLEYANKQWVDVDRDIHNLGRVLVAQLPNNPRSGDPYGRSEITRAVRSYTDSAMRTLVGAEVAREFYSAPQRYILGASEDTFLDADGKPLNAWSVYQGRVLGIPYNEAEGVMPQVGQFNANDTRPYFDQIRAYAQMLAAETAIPTNYLGFQTDNPASADAIRQMEARLVKRAERRQRQFGRTWSEVARLALLVRDGEVPEEATDIRPIWRDASTPTRAAAADEAVKLIAAGVLLPDSEITYNRIGLSDSDKQQLKIEKRVAQASSLIGNLAAAAQAATQNPEVADLASRRTENGQAAPAESGRPDTVDEFQGVRTGDIVNLVDGRTGRVEHIMIGGTLGVPGSQFAIQGTEEDPAVQVRLFENGAETENVVNVRFSEIVIA